MIPDATIQRVIEASDIISEITPHVEKLQLRHGGNTASCLCPFHREKTASFTANRMTGRYKCFGCGAGGNVIDFHRELFKVGFQDAIELLAKKHGIEVEKDVEAQRREQQRQQYLAKAAQVYSRRMEAHTPESMRYLYNRGITFAKAIEWDIGFNPRTSRVSFAIRDHHGEVVGFSDRTITNEHPKYINTAEGPEFQKGSILYGFTKARLAMAREGYAVLVEGQIDTITMHMLEFPNTVCPLGTALTEKQAQCIARLCKSVILLFDDDDAGRQAAGRAFKIFSKLGVEVKVATLPAGQDPNQIVMSCSTYQDAQWQLAGVLSKAVSYPEFLSAQNDKAEALLVMAIRACTAITDAQQLDAAVATFSRKLNMREGDFRAKLAAPVQKDEAQPKICPTISALCALCLYHRGARDKIRAREYKAASFLVGAPTLFRLVESDDYEPGNPGSVELFLPKLPEEDAKLIGDINVERYLAVNAEEVLTDCLDYLNEHWLIQQAEHILRLVSEDPLVAERQHREAADLMALAAESEMKRAQRIYQSL